MNQKAGKALVVGAGISGIRSALDLAEAGYGVTLIDGAAHLGGVLSQLDYQFPTDRCGMCKMLPLLDRDAASQTCLRRGLFHENIEVLLSTEIAAVAGEAGNFQVRLRRKPDWIDASLCNGCGACEAACPVWVADSFNAGLGKRKAVHLPVPHAIANAYVIDTAACSRCGACEAACPTGAIRLSGRERQGFHILVVDDEPILRDSLRDWLSDEEGFSVSTAASGPDALALLQTRACQLMLLDIKMPGMDGVEVLTRAKEIRPEMPVLMMTAYATVETAVEAMKTGALDYLIKPFDPEALIPKVVGIYEAIEAAKGPQLSVGALVLCGGSAYFDPRQGRNTLGYKTLPGVVTSLEFERIISGTGPFRGRLVRPEDGRPVERIAWIQCVGSRDLQTGADFCSSICCMMAVKEARLAREKFGERIDATIFYMDMRCFGKSHQRYRDRAESELGIRFERGRVHSVIAVEKGRRLAVRYAPVDGPVRDECYDMIVLAVGQRPAEGTGELAEMLQIPLNPWGFCEASPHSLVETRRKGVLLGGAYSGLKDITESVIQASAAALNASRVIHAAGGSLTVTPPPTAAPRDVLRETPRVLIIVCTCGESLSKMLQGRDLAGRLARDPQICGIEFADKICTAKGWEELEKRIEKHRPNRLLIGACLPHLHQRTLIALAGSYGLNPALMEVVDIRTPCFPLPENDSALSAARITGRVEAALRAGAARLKAVDPVPVPSVPVIQRALVIGGGIAGMTASLAISDHGYEVDLVEQKEVLGGNLNWLKTTLEGHATRPLLAETVARIEAQPLVTVHRRSRIKAAEGEVGSFRTLIESEDGETVVLSHGVVILAPGGRQASTTAYSYEKSDAIITQKELEEKLADGSLNGRNPGTIVMIQCVDSREAPRNYCSRVCCAAALKNALALKEKQPGTAIYILYRDMMSTGFMETHFTRARREGILFIQYRPDRKPEVIPSEGPGQGAAPVTVRVFDPILNRELEFHADWVVLSTGIVSNLDADTANAYGAQLDEDGFFKEADPKWRPVDAMKEGVFACGLALAPRSLPETIATAEAASQRALRILSRKQLPAARTVATVRHSLCSRCERCIDACPYGARHMDPERGQVQVNPAMCQGCGACAAVCPNGAAVVEGFRKDQMLEIIDAALCIGHGA
jgi:heterodisulfide reductase subunit A2